MEFCRVESGKNACSDIWLIAENDGDDKYKSTVQQLNMRFPLVNQEGKEQHILFPQVKDQKGGTSMLKLNASTNAGLPVYYYAKEGPAIIKDDVIIFARLPKKAKYPVKVTVVAWQYGRSVEPKIQSAEPVERTFYIFK